MTPDAIPNPLLQNQSLVRFRSGQLEQVAYSNTVVTPLLGPILTLMKSSAETEASLGQTIAFRIDIKNKGNRDAQVTLYDTPPVGTSFISNSVICNGVPLPGIDPVTGIPVGTVKINGAAEVVFQVIVVSIPNDFQLSNQAEARYTFVTEDERIVAGAATSNTITIPVKAFQISASLLASTEYTFIGDNVTYGVTIVNEGYETIHDLLIRMPLPPGTQFVPGSVVIDGIFTPSYDPVQGIPVETLLSGASVYVTFRLQVIELPPTAQLTSHAFITYRVREHSYSLETNSVTIQVIDPSLSIVNSVNYVRATVSDTLKYQIIVTNNGTYAVNASLALAIPAYTLFVWDSIYVNGAQLKGAVPSEPIRLGLITAGSQAVVTFEVNIPSIDTPNIPPLTNQTKVFYTYRLPDGRVVQNAAASNTVATELVVPIIQLHAEVEPQIVEVGDTADCKVLAANVGNWPADIFFTQYIPKGTTYKEGSLRIIGSSLHPEINNGVVSLGPLQPNNTFIVFYSIRVDEDDRLHQLKLYIVARYEYDLDGRAYSGEVRSNVVTIIVEDRDE
ncbi:DUF11 domain-containing protein [Paenibacillus sp. UNC451MF]|uniref:DUF11 domain-containing protein n=1 Tax=Paenibacillus sp. UNC451MF TaxID=1449063 RepID=UPI00048C1446|nr:DUF11 domain-containing protein [Paenibacillus sp. UNC451MF]